MRKETEEIFSQRKVDVIHSAYIAHTLYQQQKLGKYCDLKVLVGDKQYFVHRCILAAASAQLDSQINGLDTIQLVGVTYYGFECLLEILYSGKLRDVSLLSDSKFQQIVSAADALNAEIVMEYCTRERGDLMNTLLAQSNAANPPVPNEAQGVSEKMLQETRGGEATANQATVTIQRNETEAASQNSLQSEAVIKDVKTENRNEDFGYSEGPVAAEVEVDSTQKQDGAKPGEVPLTETANNSQQNIQRKDQAQVIENRVPIPCGVCGAIFSNASELAMHLPTHMVEQLYRCEICGIHFKYEAALINHRKIHCTCQFCGHECQSLHELQAHHQQMHSEQLMTQYPVDNQVPTTKSNRSQKRKSGVTPSMTRNKIGGKPAINPVIVNEIMRGENGKYQCPLCDRGFDRRWNLKCHVLIHTAPEKEKQTEARYAEAVFTCPECSKLFRNLHNLRRHALSMHGMKAADLDEASDMGLTTPTEQREIVVTASNKRAKKETSDQQPAATAYKFWCSICGRGFKRNRNLRGHMETHQSQGLAKYECPVCHRKFAQKESLNGHLWVHKTSRGEEDAAAPKVDFAVGN